MNKTIASRAAMAAAGLVLGLALCCQPAVSMAGSDANAFNPYAGKELPSSRTPKGDEAGILKAIGGRPRSIAADTAYRQHGRQELYPCLWGDIRAPHEVLVLLDFASPDSRPLWKAVTDAVKRTSPDRARVVLFGKSGETYGTDLTGMAIWAARERQGQAMEYVSWALRRWDEVKEAQRKMGTLRPFRDEYDAVAGRRDYPMTFMAMTRFKPAVPDAEQSDIARYAYDAGNVNMFQASEVCTYYGVERVPALVVDGVVYTSMSADRLAGLLKP